MRVFAMMVVAVAVGACGEQQRAPVQGAVVSPPSGGSTARLPDDANLLSVAQISSRMVGEFRSTQDDRATITVTSDGKWVEAYDGSEPSAYLWRVFSGDDPPVTATESFTPASRYLELKSKDHVFYYELGTVSVDGFDMFYTARGNMLDYARIKAPA